MAAARRTVRSDVVLEHAFLTVRVDTVRAADGRTSSHVVATGPDIATAVPVWDDGTVTLLSQRRHGLRARSIEVPGGHFDAGERPLAAARRELREETGLTARRWTPLLTFLPAIKLRQRFHVFLAEGLREGASCPDDDEDIRLIRVPLADACRAAALRRMVHGPSILALLAARDAVSSRRG